MFVMPHGVGGMRKIVPSDTSTIQTSAAGNPPLTEHLCLWCPTGGVLHIKLPSGDEMNETVPDGFVLYGQFLYFYADSTVKVNNGADDGAWLFLRGS